MAEIFSHELVLRVSSVIIRMLLFVYSAFLFSGFVALTLRAEFTKLFMALVLLSKYLRRALKEILFNGLHFFIPEHL